MGSDGRLREARRTRGLTQQQLAAAAGLTTSTISLLERTERVPTHEHGQALAAALELSVDDLFARTWRMRSQPQPDDQPVRTLRLGRGMSQRELNRAAGVTLGVVQRAEAGKRLSPASVASLAEYFGVTPATIQPVEEPTP